MATEQGTAVVLGGRSEIGMRVALRLVAGGADTVVLAARRSSELTEERSELLAAGARVVECVEFDADELSTHAGVLAGIAEAHPRIDVVVTAFGVLGDQERAEREAAHAVAIVHTDYVAHVSVLTHAANLLRERGHGALVVFSSVAGVRVRRANYVYGSAKAGLDGFASGLADAMAGSGARVLIVRPGFVVGRMTTGMSPAPFSSTPDTVARATVDALRGGRVETWVPGILRWVFAGLRLLPRWAWRRMPR